MKRRALLLAAAVVVAAAWRSPFLQAERYKPRVHQAIEKALNRKVDIAGRLRFSLLTGFGFSLENVVIHEDPAMGIEPFAYVASLDARLKLSSLLRGRWEVSRIVLDEPTVNLVKHPSGAWNVRPLLGRSASAASIETLPEIQVRAGRLNFKFGDTKAVVYCMNADVDITPRSNSEIGIRFSVEPARTDRPARGFGTLSGSGGFRWVSGKPGELDLNIDVERTALSGLALQLEGHGAGMSGFLASRAHIRGPLSALKIDGRLRLEDVQRWNLLNVGGGDWPVRYQGTLQFPAGELDLETRSESEPAPFRLRLRAHTLLENASWGAILHFREQPVAALAGLLRYMDVMLPDRVNLDGKLSGVLGYSRLHGLQGVVEVPEATVKAGDAGARLASAVVTVERDVLRLRPSRLDLGNGHSAEIHGFYSPGARSFTWNSVGQPLPVETLLAAQRQLAGVSAIPLLDAVAQGEWNGSLRYDQAGETPPAWSGAYQLRNARLSVNGLAEPLTIRSASVTIRENRIAMDGIAASIGKTAFRASYREERALSRPHRLRIQAEQADVVELEKLFLPTLVRRTGFLARTLQLSPAPLPDWLRDRRLDAQVEVKSLTAGNSALGAMSARVQWTAAQVSVTNLRLAKDDTAGLGELTIRLTQTEPAYRLSGAVRNLAWKGGTVEAEGTIDTIGAGVALLRNAKSVGRFSAEGLELADGAFRTVTGAFEFAVTRSGPLLRLSGLEASLGPETFTGQGRSENDGRMQVELASSQRRLRMAGTLWPFDLENVARQ